jgi:hypothetical protein
MTKHTGQLTLGQLIDALEKRDQSEHVRFDFCGTFPGRIDSYRGYYEDLALGWLDYDYEKQPPTVAQLIESLKECVGRVFTGYKGGDYEMDRDTAMWVANYGRSDGTCITGVTGEYGTIITTAWEPL